MATIVHFIDVGQGSMVLIETDSKQFFLYDCNVTRKNESRVLKYIESVVGSRGRFRAFICSHRDADHIRGIEKIDSAFPIGEIWDNDYPSLWNLTSEDSKYLDVRDEISHKVIRSKTRYDFGKTRFRFLSSWSPNLPDDSNSNSIVMKIEHRDKYGDVEGSVVLAGDSNVATWKYGVFKYYLPRHLEADVLMASHHGSLSAFIENRHKKRIYTKHIKAISPMWTVISTDGYSYGHPNKIALRLYRNYTSGFLSNRKIRRTDQLGTMRLNLRDLTWK